VTIIRIVSSATVPAILENPFVRIQRSFNGARVESAVRKLSDKAPNNPEVTFTLLTSKSRPIPKNFFLVFGHLVF
jgi:hypothetical protein